MTKAKALTQQDPRHPIILTHRTCDRKPVAKLLQRFRSKLVAERLATKSSEMRVSGRGEGRQGPFSAPFRTLWMQCGR